MSVSKCNSSSSSNTRKFIEENVRIKNAIAAAVPTQEKFIEENVRMKNAIAAAVPTQEKFIEENVRIKNAIAAAVPTQEKFIEENVRIKNATAAAVPTQEKFIEENVHTEVQKNIYQQFQQTRLPFNRHSRTPGHGLLVHGLLVTNGCPRLEGRKTRKTMSGAS
ncbi:hypothetical protein TNCV_4572141 [Trichonephila clavipes]|nr:hypothetical protein TNCV_4572141 [Trichonephila clavipes]